MYHVYVLRSLKNKKHYVGFTAKGVEARLHEHNRGANQRARQNAPFALLRVEEFPDRFLAQRRERFLKSGHGRAFLDQIIPR